MSENSFNCIKISRSALRNNFQYIKKSVGSAVKVMAMVKADGYGHGMVMAARAFADAGCTIFGVAEMREAVLLRQSGVEGRIYVTIGFDSKDVDLFFQYDLTPVIYSYDAAYVLSRRASQLGKDIDVHLKIDSGMSRLGIFVHDLPEFLNKIAELPGIAIAGVMSHFPESDDPTSSTTAQGYKVFSLACNEIKKRTDTVCHIANSGAVLNFPDTYCDMVRPGIALYGYHPAGRFGSGPGKDNQLSPAMSFVTRILQVKMLPAGAGVSYGHTYHTQGSLKIAVLPVGYEDGFSRALSNVAEVVIGGIKVPVIGRICMNMCMVNVTSVDDVKGGDEAVIMGTQGEISVTAEDIAEGMGSISYEVLCMLGNNNKRMYIE